MPVHDSAPPGIFFPKGAFVAAQALENEAKYEPMIQRTDDSAEPDNFI
jgi:hypothetical protein